MELKSSIRDALLRIQIEYIEMPDLKLTARQAQRLWNLPHDVCERALATLTRNGFLIQSSNGAYVRSGLRRTRIELIESLVRAS